MPWSANAEMWCPFGFGCIILTNLLFCCVFERLFLLVMTLFFMPLGQKSLLFVLLTSNKSYPSESANSWALKNKRVWCLTVAATKQWNNQLVVKQLSSSQCPASMHLLIMKHLVHPKLFQITSDWSSHLHNKQWLHLQLFKYSALYMQCRIQH